MTLVTHLVTPRDIAPFVNGTCAVVSLPDRYWHLLHDLHSQVVLGGLRSMHSMRLPLVNDPEVKETRQELSPPKL